MGKIFSGGYMGRVKEVGLVGWCCGVGSGVAGEGEGVVGREGCFGLVECVCLGGLGGVWGRAELVSRALGQGFWECLA